MGGLFWFGLMLGTLDDPRTWDEVKSGQCLTVSQMQTLSKVYDTDIYSGGSCSNDYLLSGERLQVFACGIQFDAGEWSRRMVKHKEAGFFWPGSVPCQISVEEAMNRRLEHAPVGEVMACVPEEFGLLFDQTERFVTKEFSAGQGELFLPHPFTVERRAYLETPLGTAEFCEGTEIFLEYTGFGKLKGRVFEYDCATQEERICREAKLAASKNEDGETCLKIERIALCQN